MNRHGEAMRLYRPAIAVLGFTIFAIQVGKAGAGDTAQPSWDPKAAAAYLDGRAEWWVNWSGAARGQGTTCLSCHTSMPFALSRPALGEQLGEKSPGAAEQRVIENLKKRVDNWDKIASPDPVGKDPFVPYYPKTRQPSALGTE